MSLLVLLILPCHVSHQGKYESAVWMADSASFGEHDRTGCSGRRYCRPRLPFFSRANREASSSRLACVLLGGLFELVLTIQRTEVESLATILTSVVFGRFRGFLVDGNTAYGIDRHKNRLLSSC